MFSERPLGYYLFEIYTPAVFIVIMSWLNFWVNRSVIITIIIIIIIIILIVGDHYKESNPGPDNPRCDHSPHHYNTEGQR